MGERPNRQMEPTRLTVCAIMSPRRAAADPGDPPQFTLRVKLVALLTPFAVALTVRV